MQYIVYAQIAGSIQDQSADIHRMKTQSEENISKLLNE